MAMCETCDGSGTVRAYDEITTAEGYGTIVIDETCPACNGTGTAPDAPAPACMKCNDTGIRQISRKRLPSGGTSTKSELCDCRDAPADALTAPTDYNPRDEFAPGEYEEMLAMLDGKAPDAPAPAGNYPEIPDSSPAPDAQARELQRLRAVERWHERNLELARGKVMDERELVLPSLCDPTELALHDFAQQLLAPSAEEAHDA